MKHSNQNRLILTAVFLAWLMTCVYISITYTQPTSEKILENVTNHQLMLERQLDTTKRYKEELCKKGGKNCPIDPILPAEPAVPTGALG